ncbi:hypothetical protein Patl1_05951 [Pistacia atlantica]|uniref:Uncharacterized protein n=1 Tax=Pistacia atlantica TaxID=434234 RepID=A0ACC1BVR0_9ROSI|nr:hypothetical protein Patl1_05951 [Pistacia atlantica]
MVECLMILMNSWGNEIECGGGMAGLNIDEYIRRFLGDVIPRAAFGSNYSKEEEIFKTLTSLQEALSRSSFSEIGVPGTKFITSAIYIVELENLRYFPTKTNR